MRARPKLYTPAFFLGLWAVSMEAGQHVMRYILGKRKVCPELMEPYKWWNYAAPVIPPTDVKNRVRETGRSVDWQNLFWTGKFASAIFYRTRLADPNETDDEFVTHVLPGSYEVSVSQWMRKIADEEEPKNDGYW